MAIIWGRPTVQLKIAVEFSEAEARALYDIARYDVDAFLKVFFEKMGKVYLEKHETALRLLFASLIREVGPWLTRVDSARDTFEKETKSHAS